MSSARTPVARFQVNSLKQYGAIFMIMRPSEPYSPESRQQILTSTSQQEALELRAVLQPRRQKEYDRQSQGAQISVAGLVDIEWCNHPKPLHRHNGPEKSPLLDFDYRSVTNKPWHVSRFMWPSFISGRLHSRYQDGSSFWKGNHIQKS